MDFTNINTIKLENESSSLIIEPDRGMTTISYEYEGEEMIWFDEDRRNRNANYGIPILFPTPNTVLNDTFTFEGTEYNGYTHGIVRNCRFDILKKEKESVTGRLSIRKDNSLYELFPFQLDFTVTIKLKKNGIHWYFTIESLDEKNIPFGIAIHPFFIRKGKEMFLSTAPYEMQLNQDKSLTGVLHDSGYQTNTDTSSLKGTHLLYSDTEAPINIFFNGTHSIRIKGDENFIYSVLFSNPGSPFFCVEPQTSAIDAINLYSTDIGELSGLQIIEPGKTIRNSVDISIK